MPKVKNLGYFLELAKKDGFEGPNAFKEWNEWRKKNGKFPDAKKIKQKELEEFAKKNGYRDYNEYQRNYRNHFVENRGYDFNEYMRNNRDRFAQNSGYKDYNEYQKEYNLRKGIHLQMSDNEDCSIYLGIYIGERVIAKQILEMIFEHIEEMPINNNGFDFICKDPRLEFINKFPIYKLERNEEYKIDAKCASLTEIHKWKFHIRNNIISDYFLLIGIDNRSNLEPSYIWLIRGDEIIRNKKINDRYIFGVTNEEKYLGAIQKYLLEDELMCFKRKYV